jgi:hypothetical protein
MHTATDITASNNSFLYGDVKFALINSLLFFLFYLLQFFNKFSEISFSIIVISFLYLKFSITCPSAINIFGGNESKIGLHFQYKFLFDQNVQFYHKLNQAFFIEININYFVFQSFYKYNEKLFKGIQ